MKLTDAIVNLHQDLRADTYDLYPGLYQAQKLAVQVMIHFQSCRYHGCDMAEDLLPEEHEG